MNEETKKRKFEALKEIKDRYYVGSKEAYSILRDIDEVTERPKKLAEMINERLGETSYPATPERIVGIIEFLEITNGIMQINGGAIMNSTYCLFLDDYIIGDNLLDISRDRDLANLVRHIISRDDQVKITPLSKLLNSMFPFFEKARDMNVQEDEEMGKVISFTLRDRAAYLCENAQSIMKNSEEYDFVPPEEIEREKEDFAKSALLYSLMPLRFDFKEIDFKKVHDKKIAEVFSRVSESIDGLNLFENIRRDGVDNRLEYQRMLITNFILKGGKESYEDSVSRIYKRKERYEKVLNSRFVVDAFREGNEKYLEFNTFLYRLFKSDRNFIRRYLGERK